MTDTETTNTGLDHASKEDLAEIYAFLHAARIASAVNSACGSIDTGIRRSIIEIMDTVEAEMSKRDMEVPPIRMGERVYSKGCAIVDEWMAAND